MGEPHPLALIALSALLLTGASPRDWSTYTNARYGYRTCFPPKLLHPDQEADNGDGRAFRGKDGAQLLVFGSNNVDNRSLAKEASDQASSYVGAHGSISYYSAGKGWVVISGHDGTRTDFYTKTFQRADQFVSFQLKYPHVNEAVYKPLIERLNRCFTILKPAF